MIKNDEFQQFLDGGEIPAKNKIGKQEADFVTAYKELIRQSKNEEIADFDAFEKVKQRKGSFQIKRLIPYAAILVLLLCMPVLLHFINKKPESPKYTEAQITEAMKNTEMALSYFSQEWNSCLTNFNDVKINQQFQDELKNLKELKIEFTNPIKNLKFDES